MKKLITLIIITAAFASCSKKSDDTATLTGNTTLMLGKWKDGAETDNYYKAGKLVYTVTIPATTTPAHTYQFNTDGTFVVNSLQANGSYTVNVTYTSWLLTDGNTFLHYVNGSSSYDKPISFSDNNNTAVITSTFTGGVTYTDNNNATQTADSETAFSTLVRQ